jgi:hypothetical protein
VTNWPPKDPKVVIYCDRLSCHLPAGDCSQRWWRRIYRSAEPYFPSCGPHCEEGAEVVLGLGTKPRRNRMVREKEAQALERARLRVLP